MRSKLLFSAASVLCLSVLFASSARATWVPPGVYKPNGPLWAIDLGRSITGIIQGVLTLCGDGDAKAELIAVQEGTNKNADGTSDDSPNTTATSQATGTAAATALTNGVYGYVQSEILSQTDLTKYSVLQQDLASPKAEGNARATCESLNFTADRPKNTCIAVVDTFFADKGTEGNTEEYKEMILGQRRAYAHQVAKKEVTIGYNVQQKVIEDLHAASEAPVSSDNEIGAIAIDGQALDEMIKVTVADVALQIEMMEADAVTFLLQQPVEIMTQEKPAE